MQGDFNLADHTMVLGNIEETIQGEENPPSVMFATRVQQGPTNTDIRVSDQRAKKR